MGFTIEDMLLVSKERYQMELVSGKEGWSNSISWLIMLEDFTIINNFSGKELAVTTGLGFQKEEELLGLIITLDEHHASGLVINSGYYIKNIPDSVKKICDEREFPLLTVPWDIYIVDMIKDLSIRVFLQGTVDEQISASFIKAIEKPEDRANYIEALLANYDIDGTFQAVVIFSDILDKMDSVERKRIGYRLQLYCTNLTHNGHFFYYDSAFVIILNDVGDKDAESIIETFTKRVRKKMPEIRFFIGIGSKVKDIGNLYISYKRAREAVRMAEDSDNAAVYFDEMGIYRLLYSIEDKALLKEMSDKLLGPLIEYDKIHNSDYVETLENYLKYDSSIQKVSEAMYIHRNTIAYRMNSIRKLLGTDLGSVDESLPYLIACIIRHIKK